MERNKLEKRFWLKISIKKWRNARGVNEWDQAAEMKLTVRTDNSKKLRNLESFYTHNKIIVSGKF